ncbi:transcription antitermination factor NusB [Spiroplasma endosymbiont of Crioceris asparagi]|uniref:transcription antitermination factor NusB n=1 Tax=Spiroplasma endosymbiont of Crioceris asparagi TaxID=3066286 RepID=UPI0030D123B4
MNTRLTIVKILIDVFKNNKFSNVLINKLFKNSNPNDEQDLNFIVNCVYGTIQNKLYFEEIASQFINIKKTKIEAQIILFEALYEKIVLDKPDYAIVNNSVETTKKINFHLSGLINKVLKNIFTNLETLKTLSWIKDEDKKNMIKNSMPLWLGQKIIDQYGKETFLKLANDINRTPNNYFIINFKLITKTEFMNKYQAQYNIVPSLLSNEVYFMNNSVVKTEFFKNNEIYIQDVTSTLAIKKLALKNESIILDMCCAPGGKSVVASMFSNKSKIIANDINETKKNLIIENFKKAKIENYELIIGNALELDESQLYDAIILDAPCSGYGLIKRKPETRYHEITNDYQDLLMLQSKLLEKAYKLLKVNGKLVYSTCTIFKEENDNQINNFSKKYSNMKIEYQQQFFGFEENNNGFFICVMIKN